MLKHLQEINQLTDQPTKRQAYRKTSTQPRIVQEHVRHFDSSFFTSEMRKNPKNGVWDMLTDQPTKRQAYRKTSTQPRNV